MTLRFRIVTMTKPKVAFCQPLYVQFQLKKTIYDIHKVEVATTQEN